MVKNAKQLLLITKEIRRRNFKDIQAVILFPSILDGQAIYISQ